jgi:hypothetical protein
MHNVPGGLEIYDSELVQQMSESTLREGLRWDVERGHDDVLIAWMLSIVTCAQYPPPNILSYKANYLDKQNQQEGPSTVMEALHAQPDWVHALKRDLAMILRPQNPRTLVSSGKSAEDMPLYKLAQMSSSAAAQIIPKQEK